MTILNSTLFLSLILYIAIIPKAYGIFSLFNTKEFKTT